jgi:hypothetical protein
MAGIRTAGDATMCGMSAEPAIALPRWAEVARTACKASVGIYATLYLIGFVVNTVRWLQNGGRFWSPSTNASWDWYEVVIFAGLAATAVIGGLLWLAGEAVRGFREPRE